MLQEYANAIVEMGEGMTPTVVGNVTQLTTSNVEDDYPQVTQWWGGYPVYVCTDKTAKAIEVLKALQAEKLLECKSVPKFIELVEKIAKLL